MAQAVTLVPYGVLHTVIPSLVSYLETSEMWTKGRASVDDLIRFLYTGQMNLWLFYDDSTQETLGYVMTEIKQYPQCSMLVFQCCAGDYGTLPDVVSKAFNLIEQFAKDAGCSGIEFFGRPGWRRFAKDHGCTEKTVLYEKYFDRV